MEKNRFLIFFKNQKKIFLKNIFFNINYKIPVNIILYQFHENFFFIKIFFLKRKNFEKKTYYFFLEQFCKYYIKKGKKYQKNFQNFIIKKFNSFNWKKFINNHLIKKNDQIQYIYSENIYFNYIKLKL